MCKIGIIIVPSWIVMNEVTHVRGLSTGPAYYWEVDVLENGEGPPESQVLWARLPLWA